MNPRRPLRGLLIAALLLLLGALAARIGASGDATEPAGRAARP